MTKLNKEKLRRILNSYAGPLSFLLYFVGLFWFFLLSQDELNHQTYMSENALLVGQVVERFSDDSLVRRLEADLIRLFANGDSVAVRRWLMKQLGSVGLEVYEQNFTFSHPLLHPISEVTGANVYAIMRSPSGGRTEALLLTVPLKSNCQDSRCLAASVSLIISLMNVLRGQIYWAKDIVVVFPESEYLGLMAWLEAYHGSHKLEHLSWTELKGRSGAIQAGLNLDLNELNANSLSISSEGINGLMANLDLVNTVVRLAHKHSIQPIVNGQIHAYDRESFEVRKVNLLGLLRAVWSQASGSPTGLHGLLINYQIPAVTLTDGSTSFMKKSSNSIISFGRLVEGVLRSLNNLQERLHQSFWNYLLPTPLRYISIGVYMPPLIILISSMLVKVLSFWLIPDKTTPSDDKEDEKSNDSMATTPLPGLKAVPSNSPDQEVRKRKAASKVHFSSEVDGNASAKEILEKDGVAIPPTLSYLTIWVFLSFASGFGFSRLPALIYQYQQLQQQHQTDHSAEENILIPIFTGNLLAAGLLMYFVMITLLLPWLTRTLQSCFATLPETPRRWYGSIILISWTLFLACTAFLNASASLVIGVIVVPSLLLFVQQTAQSKLHSLLFGCAWLLVSPPSLLAFDRLTKLVDWDQYSLTVSAFAGNSGSLLSALWTQSWQLLTQILMEADVLGSWVWSALTAGFSSLWLLTWVYVCLVE